MEPHVDSYNPRDRATAVLQGNYQKVYNIRPKSAAITSSVLQARVAGRDTKATKQTILASNHLETHQTTLNHYKEGENSNPQVVDLVMSHLPPYANAETLKKISGSKHVFEATVDEDNLKGICAGTGRIKIRLNHGETADKVKLNFLRQGIHVQDHESDPRKRPVVTGIPREKSKEVTNHHYEKQLFLITQQPEIYGTTQKYLPIPQQE